MAKVVEQYHKDHFDRLPDAILLDIFTKLLDAKSLTRCLSVCKRFSSLIPQINTIFLPIPRREPISKPSNGLLLNSIRIVFNKFKTKKLKYFRRIIASKSSARNIKDSSNSCPPSLINVLKTFREIKSMHVQLQTQLPLSCGITRMGSDGGDCLIKWKAEFGRELKSCIILGATSFRESSIGIPAWENSNEEEEEEERFLTDDQLKLRIAWTISCLLSASTRHHFLKQIVSGYPNLQNVVISDCNNQGKLCMDEEQLLEMRKSMDNLMAPAKSSLERTPVPDVSIKMTYLPVLKLPASGYTLRGATLVVIKPVGGVISERSDDRDGEREDKTFGEGVRKMMNVKRSYLMTMNSF